MESSVNQRFVEAFKWTELTSHALSKRLSANAKTIWNYTDGGKDPSPVIVRKLCQEFPQLSYDWIMRGTGNMLEGTPVTEDVHVHSAAALTDIVVKLEEKYKTMIDSLRDQLKAANERCASLEEINKTFLDMIQKSK